MKKQIKPVEVFAGNSWQVGILKSLFENAEIQAYLKDEFLGTLTPWWTSPGGAGPITLFVSNKDYDKAKQIVDDYLKNTFGNN